MLLWHNVSVRDKGESLLVAGYKIDFLYNNSSQAGLLHCNSQDCSNQTFGLYHSEDSPDG